MPVETQPLILTLTYFNIGDRVRVLVDNPSGRIVGPTRISAGSIGTIDRINPDRQAVSVIFQSGRWWIEPQHLAKVTERELSPFRIGQRVIVQRDPISDSPRELGQVGFVSQIHPRELGFVQIWSSVYSQLYCNVKHLEFAPRVSPRPESAKSFTQFRELVKAALENDYDAIIEVVDYLALVMVSFDRDECLTGVKKIARERVKKFLIARTGYVYVENDNDISSLIRRENAYTVHADNGLEVYVTESTFDEDTSDCYGCNGRFFVEDMEYPDGDYHCRSCYNDAGYFYCGGCEEHRQHSCEECEVDNPRTRPRNNSNTGDIHGYSTNVLHFVKYLRTEAEEKQKIPNRLFFGIELEVLTRAKYDVLESAQACGEALKGFAILKHDGSLESGSTKGFEIVTAPGTLDYHRKQGWNEFFKEGGAWRKVRSWNTGVCGLHIHFSREALSTMQMSKFLVFMNDSGNSEFLTRIAGREINSKAEWCAQKAKKLGAMIMRREDGSIRSCHSIAVNESLVRGGDHYYAAIISESTGHSTCEVRIFRGNSSRHGVMRALDFVAALIEFCGVTTAGDYISKARAVRKKFGCVADKIEIKKPGLSWEAFIHWFSQQSNRGKYPDLWRQLLDLKILDTAHTFKEKLANGLLVDAVLESEPLEPGEVVETPHSAPRRRGGGMATQATAPDLSWLVRPMPIGLAVEGQDDDDIAF